MLGPSVYSIDGRALEAVVGDLLREHRLTIAAAESCTGGLLASRLTDVPGSSDYVDRGVVCYSNRSKTELAGVPEALIAEHGAVSEPVARAMAEGIRRARGTNVGVGITGIAGPGGGTPEKPVGTVAIAVVVDDEVRVRTFQFLGSREMVKFQAAQSALNMTRLMVLRQPGTARVGGAQVTMRLFVAVDLSNETRDAMAAEQKRIAAALGSDAASLKWVRPEQRAPDARLPRRGRRLRGCRRLSKRSAMDVDARAVRHRASAASVCFRRAARRVCCGSAIDAGAATAQRCCSAS